MLRHLFELALLVEPSRFPSLLLAAQRALPREAGRLAQTLRHLARTHADALEQVRGLEGWEQLRVQVLEGEPAAASSTVEEAFLDWQERWISAGG
jgi:hypothetical protein